MVPMIQTKAAAGLLETVYALPFTAPQLAVLGGTALFLLVALIVVIVRSFQRKLKAFWGILSVLLICGGIVASVFGMEFGTVYTRSTGNPADTAYLFCSALTTGDYDTAYSYLGDYASLGLENEPESAVSEAMYDALQESWSFEFVDVTHIIGLDAKQHIIFTYLDLMLLRDDVQAETGRILEEIAASRTVAEVYDEEGKYRPEITDEAYTEAVRSVLKNAPSYYNTTEFDLELKYVTDSWKVYTNPALLFALTGGTSL